VGGIGAGGESGEGWEGDGEGEGDCGDEEEEGELWAGAWVVRGVDGWLGHGFSGERKGFGGGERSGVSIIPH
jgi:hypothetical protein